MAEIIVSVMILGLGLAVQRGGRGVFEHGGFGLYPVLQGMAFGLPALVVQMLRMQANLSFKQLGHEGLLLFPTGIGIQNYSFGS